MRQKLALAVVFGPQTPLLILDEPTANLDPTVRAEVLQLVTEAQDEGRTVLLSSHVLGEIEQTCGRVAFLRRGLLAHQLVMADLFQRHRITALAPSGDVAIPPALADRVKLEPLRRGGGPTAGTPVRLDTAGDLAPLLGWIDSLGLRQVRIEPLGLRAVYDAVHFGDEVTV
jgi:ABC-2 type transport system ATP-binding protein